MHPMKSHRILFLILFVSTFALAAFAQDNLPAPLTNSDIVKMVKAGVSEGVIVRTIQISEPNFSITPDALISLKHQHVPNNVMAAMVDSQASSRSLAPNTPSIEYVGGQPHSVHLHQLPNVDVAVRIDSKTSGKVEVRKNQIKVEKAGVPLFSVKWKVNEQK